jgi:hypothetical protein
MHTARLVLARSFELLFNWISPADWLDFILTQLGSWLGSDFLDFPR